MMLAAIEAADLWGATLLAFLTVLVGTIGNWWASRGVRRELRDHMTNEETAAADERSAREAGFKLVGDRLDVVAERFAVGSQRIGALESGQHEIMGALGQIVEQQAASEKALRETLRSVVAGNPEIRRTPVRDPQKPDGGSGRPSRFR